MQIDQQTERMRQVVREKSALTQEKASAERELKTLKRQLQMMQQENDKVAKTNTKVKETQTMIQQLEKKNESLLKSNTKLKTQISVFEEAQEASLQSLQRAEAEKQNIMQRFDQERSLLVQQIHQIETSKAEVEQHLKEVMKQLQETIQDFQTICAHANQQKTELAEKQKCIDQLEKFSHDLEDLLKAQEAEFNEVIQSRELVHEQRSKEKTATIEKVNQELEELKNLLTFERSTLSQFSTENSDLKSKIDLLNQKLLRDQKSHSSIESEFQSQVRELSALHDQETMKIEEEKQILVGQLSEMNKMIEAFQEKFVLISSSHQTEKEEWLQALEVKDEELRKMMEQIDDYKIRYLETVKSKESLEKQAKESRQSLLDHMEQTKRANEQRIVELQDQLESSLLNVSKDSDGLKRELEISLLQHKQELDQLSFDLQTKQNALSRCESELQSLRENQSCALIDHQKTVRDLQHQLALQIDLNHRHSSTLAEHQTVSSSQTRELEALKKAHGDLVKTSEEQMRNLEIQWKNKLEIVQKQLEDQKNEVENAKLENLELLDRVESLEEKERNLHNALEESNREKISIEQGWQEKRLEYMRMMKEKALEWKETKKKLLEKQHELVRELKKLKIDFANVNQQSLASFDQIIDEKRAAVSKLEDLQVAFLEQTEELNSLKHTVSRLRSLAPFDPNKENSSNL